MDAIIVSLSGACLCRISTESLDSPDSSHGLPGHCPWVQWAYSMHIGHKLSGHCPLTQLSICPWTQWIICPWNSGHCLVQPSLNRPVHYSRQTNCPLNPWTSYRRRGSLTWHASITKFETLSFQTSCNFSPAWLKQITTKI